MMDFKWKKTTCPECGQKGEKRSAHRLGNGFQNRIYAHKQKPLYDGSSALESYCIVKEIDQLTVPHEPKWKRRTRADFNRMYTCKVCEVNFFAASPKAAVQKHEKEVEKAIAAKEWNEDHPPLFVCDTHEMEV